MTIGRNVDKIFLQNAIHVFQFRQENISKLRVRVWAQNNTLATVRVCSEKNYRVSPLSPEDITSENVLREKKANSSKKRTIMLGVHVWSFHTKTELEKDLRVSPVMKVESENTSNTNEN